MALGFAAGGRCERQCAQRNRRRDPLAARPPHFAPRAKSVIFLFMAGGPSQLELFDPKPKLQELDGQVIPESFVANKRFAFIKGDAKLLGTKRKFAQHGAERPDDLRVPAAPGERRRRHLHAAGGEDRRLQSRPGEVLS